MSKPGVDHFNLLNRNFDTAGSGRMPKPVNFLVVENSDLPNSQQYISFANHTNQKEKMYRIYFKIMLLLIMGCETSNINGPEKQASTYLPLKVGNSWTYSRIPQYGENNKTTYQIFSEKTVANKKYYAFGASLDYTDWIRIDGGKIYKLVDGADILWLDFTKEDDTTYPYFPDGDPNTEDWVVLVSRDRVAEYELDKKFTYVNCADFYFDLPGAVDDEHGFVFAPGVGIVTFYGAWVNMYLESYSISNE
ncbi:MAG: hypothetical protein DWQ05_19210 [Calditrichaeota bacterium]|nr:MAG: hypothetical protein DWQ05_19210 [Calditrichota bacterium]